MADQDGNDASPAESQGYDTLPRSEERRVSSPSRPSSSGSGGGLTISLSTTPTLTTNSPTLTTTTSPTNNAASRAEPLVHKIDERQRLARERREEREKQNAVREAQWQEREERARQYYEKHLEERRRKLEEQRVKEERRRIAVEEKRRQKLEEEKARHEAVMRRTLEKSQRVKQKPNRWSWGGQLHGNTPSTPGDADRRSVSTMNLSKHADPIITKRLSYSSATLLHSPDHRALQKRTSSSPLVSKPLSRPRPSWGKTAHDRTTGMRRMPLSPWENTVVNRLQQPTHSYLARSRSAMSLSGDAATCHPGGPLSFKAIQAQPLPLCRNQDRGLPKDAAVVRRRTTGAPAPKKDRDLVRKSWSNLSLPLAPILSLPPKKRSQSPSNKPSKLTAPSPGRPPQKASGRPPTPKQLKSPGGEDPGNLRPLRSTPDSSQDLSAPEGAHPELHSPPPPIPGPTQARPQTLGQNKASPDPLAAASEGAGSPPAQKPSAGTTDAEEATRILAEKRRQAREQREREEEQRRQQEEAQRLAKEEMARRKAEERVRREEEAQRQAEEKKRREEEERQEEEERAQREKEETDRLQKQREEEESRQREEAERLKQERDKHFQKEEAERLERKKRLEEIMKRTRRSDPAEKKTTPHRNGDNTASAPDSPGTSGSAGGAAGPEHSDRNGHRASQPAPAPGSTPILTSSDSRENGQFEEVIELPPESRLSPPDEEEEEEDEEEEERRVPVIAFRENGIVKPLSSVDDVSTPQRTDVA